MTHKFSAAEVLARKEAIVVAATEVFLRYGYARTTMADLAAAIKLSRPALYVFFADKDEIFTAVVRSLNDKMLDEFRQTLPKLSTLDRRLHRCCAAWGAHGLELMEKHPDAKDLFDLSLPVVVEMCERFVDLVAELLSDALAASAFKGSARDIARNLVYSFRGLKEAAQDSVHLRRMIRLQVDLVLHALRS